MHQLILFGLVGVVMAMSSAHADPVRIVAAENFYGDIARQIGGPAAKVTSILSNPDQDPHQFETSPSAARDVAAARIVIYNGIDYDPWIEKMLGAARSAGCRPIVVADLVGRKTGDNPHIWYDPATMPALAKALSDMLIAGDPGGAAGYRERLARFDSSMAPVRAKIAELRRRLAGTPVTATESVAFYLLAALGLEDRNQAFQLAVMNETEPAASDIAAFENDLKTRRVRLLFHNSQTTGPITERMRKLAAASHIPVVGVTETQPAGMNYQGWMMSTLDAIDRALTKSSP
ncbi:MAG TPA: zinc ABC transporter substrate-binding protein [Stellaceae bacterium]|nr:zinc ABC transporter substrate-binding protein [Stellaceae bacterium]